MKSMLQSKNYFQISKKPNEVVIQLTGAQEEQAETGAFLGMAMLWFRSS